MYVCAEALYASCDILLKMIGRCNHMNAAALRELKARPSHHCKRIHSFAIQLQEPTQYITKHAKPCIRPQFEPTRDGIQNESQLDHCAHHN